MLASIERHGLNKMFSKCRRLESLDQTRSRDLLHTGIVLGPQWSLNNSNPQAMDLPSAQRHYSNEEKSQLIANLNIEGPLSVPLNFKRDMIFGIQLNIVLGSSRHGSKIGSKTLLFIKRARFHGYLNKSVV